MNSTLKEITLTGRLDAQHSAEAAIQLERAIEFGARHLRLDLRGVEYCSSAGLRVLAAAYKRARELGGSLQIVHASAAVEQMLEIAGFGVLLQLDEPDAQQAADDHFSTASAAVDVWHLNRAAVYHLQRLKKGARWVADTRPKGLPVAFGTGTISPMGESDALPSGGFLAVETYLLHQSKQAPAPDYLRATGMLHPTVIAEDGVAAEGIPATWYRATPNRAVAGLRLDDLFSVLAGDGEPVFLLASIRVLGIEVSCMRGAHDDEARVLAPSQLGAETGFSLLLAGVLNSANKNSPALEGLPALACGRNVFRGTGLLSHATPLPEGIFSADDLLERTVARPLITLAQMSGDLRHGLGFRLGSAVVLAAPAMI